ncbi:hypothetical protein D9M72_599990 [compost metagenome]
MKALLQIADVRRCVFALDEVLPQLKLELLDLLAQVQELALGHVVHAAVLLRQGVDALLRLAAMLPGLRPWPRLAAKLQKRLQSADQVRDLAFVDGQAVDKLVAVDVDPRLFRLDGPNVRPPPDRQA